MLKNCYCFVVLTLTMLCFACGTVIESSSNTNSLSSQISFEKSNQNQNSNLNQAVQDEQDISEKSDILMKTLQDCKGQSQFVYKNINFRCNPSLASHVEVSEFSESPLEREDDKDDYVHPSYLSFKFLKETENQKKESDYAMKISVYSLGNYRKMYSISKSSLERFNKYISNIKKILAEKNSQFEKQVPLLTTAGENQAVIAHLEYPSFKDGQGMSFITQISPEAELINNQKLIWIFQGITNDGENYVYATFPISAPFLPDNSETNEFEGYSIPTDFWNNKKQQQYEKKHQQYLSTIAEKLNKLDQNQYKPNLMYLKEIIASLQIK